jgi:hypothetical protein
LEIRQNEDSYKARAGLYHNLEVMIKIKIKNKKKKQQIPNCQ